MVGGNGAFYWPFPDKSRPRWVEPVGKLPAVQSSRFFGAISEKQLFLAGKQTFRNGFTAILIVFSTPKNGYGVEISWK